MTFQHNFEAEQGATFSFTLETEDDDWSNASFKMQIREEENSTSDLLVDMDQFISTTQNSFSISVPVSETSTWSWRKGYYDLFYERQDGTTIKMMKGCVTVDNKVTE